MKDAVVIKIVLFCLTLIIAAYLDFLKGKISNWVTIPAIVLGLGINAIGDLGLHIKGYSLYHSLLGLLVITLLCFIPLLLKWLGGGDVKLLIAVGVIMGYKFALVSLFYTSIVGFLLVMSIVLLRGKFITLLKVMFRRKKAIDEKKEIAEIKVPYGIAISIGGFMALFVYIMQGRL